MLTNGARAKRAIAWFIAALVVAGVLMVTGGDLQTLASGHRSAAARTYPPSGASASPVASPTTTPTATPAATPTPTATPAATPTARATARPTPAATSTPATTPTAAPEGETIRVQGASAVLFDASDAYIHIDAYIEGDNVDAAYTRANDLAAELLEQASAWGVTLADLQWQDMQLQPGTKPTLHMALRLRLQDTTKLNAALGYLVKHRLLKDARLGDPAAGSAQEDALAAALADARARAQVLAQASGKKLGELIALEMLTPPAVPDGYVGAAVCALYACKEADPS